VHVLRTSNGGLFWDDLTGNLADMAAYAITADYSAGAVYAGGDQGVYMMSTDLAGAGPAGSWTRLGANLTNQPVVDVQLDDERNQLFVAVDGEGVYAATAPHRFLSPKIVSAADWSARPAAPGALLSILGRRAASVRAGNLNVPVLAATEAESQVQVPFEISGSSLSLALLSTGRSGRLEQQELGVALQEASPAIFVDRDGTPMVLDADKGVLLDAMTPARSGARIQILATGLGKVEPAWPTGLPGPLENAPRVVAEVKVFLDRRPLEVSRATLAPGYVGFYLIEARLPDVVNLGPAELYIEAGGESSNRTRIYVEP
jgi:uncharacterized protein (TIGR03437 family)